MTNEEIDIVRLALCTPLDSEVYDKNYKAAGDILDKYDTRLMRRVDPMKMEGSFWLKSQSEIVMQNTFANFMIDPYSEISKPDPVDELEETERDIERMEAIWNAKKGTKEYDELNTLIKKYEYKLNNKDHVQRTGK